MAFLTSTTLCSIFGILIKRVLETGVPSSYGHEPMALLSLASRHLRESRCVKTRYCGVRTFVEWPVHHASEADYRMPSQRGRLVDP